MRSKRRCNNDWINPSTLDSVTRRQLWEGLKVLDPALAALLTTDPNLSQLKRALSATIRFTRDQAERYVRAGQKQIEE